MTDPRPSSPLSTAPEEIPGHGLLSGKKVVVTAAAGTGIGFATARRALLEGADVVVSDYHERRLGETAEKLSVEFGDQQVTAITCDVSSTDQVNALIDSAAGTLGRIDVLVNNAGLGGSTPVVDMTDEQWDRVLDITLTSTFRSTRAALRYFAGVEHGGVVVNNASVLGWRAQHGQAHYAAAKAGVMALTRCSAIEAVEHGVRINAVAPSIARHPFLVKVTSDEVLDDLASREVVSEAALKEHGLTPRARIHHIIVRGDDPIMMLSAPIPATKHALEKTGLSIDDIDVVEINEAFVPVVLALLTETGADPSRVNPNGGGIALGHPLGATGAKLFATMLNELERRGGRYGLQTMCEGGGTANVTIIELLG